MNLPAPVRGWEARRALKAARREADAEILAAQLPSPRLAWRIEELVDEANRTALGRAVTDVVHGADERFLPSAKPLNRSAVREARAQLLELAARLFDRERAVSPRAALLVEHLLVDGSGPLYGDGSAQKLRREIDKIDEGLGS